MLEKKVWGLRGMSGEVVDRWKWRFEKGEAARRRESPIDRG
jgi:hypothetical protein